MAIEHRNMAMRIIERFVSRLKIDSEVYGRIAR